MDDLVEDALSDLVNPPPPFRAFVEYPLDEFLVGKALWAANFFVLWPLGVALTVDVEVVPVDPAAWCGSDASHVGHAVARPDPFEPPDVCAGAWQTGEATNLHVRTWVYPDGELGETIDQSEEDNDADFRGFLAFVHRRVLGMKPDERRLLLARYRRFDIASAEQILAAVP